jgi:hypothetical protein
MVLPDDIRVRNCEQQRQPGDRESDRSSPGGDSDETSVRRRNVRRGREPVEVQRAAPLAVVGAALAADTLGAHRLAFYFLLAAIVVLAVATLERYGHVVESAGAATTLAVARFQAALGALALALALLAAAARAPVLGEAVVPPLGLSALVGALGLLLLQGLARLAK